MIPAEGRSSPRLDNGAGCDDHNENRGDDAAGVHGSR